MTEVLDQETVETARADEAEAAQTEEAPAAANASTTEGPDGFAPAAGVEAPQQTEAETMAGQDDDKMDLASPAPPVSSTATDETEATAAATKQEEQKVGTDESTAAPAKQPRPSNQFGLYFVGHKYSPNNYWCVPLFSSEGAASARKRTPDFSRPRSDR